MSVMQKIYFVSPIAADCKWKATSINCFVLIGDSYDIWEPGFRKDMKKAYLN